jgi:amidase
MAQMVAFRYRHFPPPESRATTMAKHRFLLAAVIAVGTLGCGRQERADDRIIALDAIALRAEIAAGRLSALDVTEAYLRRIAELDDAGPMLAAVVEINPEAEAIARRLDEQRGGELGPLHGVPVLLKANIDTGDRMVTSAGSLALAAHRARADAELVVKLRAAGAVVLGKTNLSEWANFRSTRSTSGWSSVGGQTRNPYVLDRNPCGSSSGSAVAVAARLAPLAVGTETDGSIVCPAAANGVVGIKPASGAVSQRGIVPIAHSQDTAGPLARTVADAGLLLSVLAESRFIAAAPRSDAAGLRVGVVRDFPGATKNAAVEASFARTLQWLEQAGALLVDPVEAALSSQTADAEFAILLAEFRVDLDLYLAGVERGPRTLEDLIAFNAEHEAEVMPHFGQELLIAARDSGGTAAAGYAVAQQAAAAARTTLAALFSEHDLDAIVAPTNSRAWRTDYATGDVFGGVFSSNIAAVTGYPSVTVPTVLAAELPLGVSLIGKPGDEPALLALGAAVERGRGAFPEPKFLASIGD